MKQSNLTIFILRLAIAALFLTTGLGKYREGWLTNPEHLATSLQNYRQHAVGLQATYLDVIAIPYAKLWSIIITIGELSVAISLFLGLLTRCSSAAAIFMVVNLHLANGNLLSMSFFESPWAGMLLAGLLLLFLSRAGRWAGIDAILAQSNARGALW